MKKLKVVWAMIAFVAVGFTACSDDDSNDTPVNENGKVILDSYEVDFGEVVQSQGKSEEDPKEVTLTLTNNTEETVEELSSSIEFPGQAAVNLDFTPLAPGESIDVVFTFSPSGLEPGEYTGKATLTPSIGEPLEVALKATVIAPDTDGKITLNKYSIDFGEVKGTQGKSTNEKTEIIVLTNNSEEVLTELSTEATFAGNLSVEFDFQTLQPGESMEIPFVFSPANEEPGEYTGTAKVKPSIGEPIEIELKVTII